MENAYKNLLEIENYLRHSMPTMVNKAVINNKVSLSFDPLEFKEKLDKFESLAAEQLDLDLFKKIFADLSFKEKVVDVYNGYIDAINDAISGKINLDELNSYVDKHLRNINFEYFKNLVLENMNQNKKNTGITNININQSGPHSVGIVNGSIYNYNTSSLEDDLNKILEYVQTNNISIEDKVNEIIELNKKGEKEEVVSKIKKIGTILYDIAVKVSANLIVKAFLG